MDLAPFYFVYDTFMTQSMTFSMNDTNKKEIDCSYIAIYFIYFL